MFFHLKLSSYLLYFETFENAKLYYKTKAFFEQINLLQFIFETYFSIRLVHLR